MTDDCKIDALVAEYVMRLPVGYMSEEDVIPFIIVDQATASFAGIPKYSTDLVDAWKVVEKLKADGFLVSVETSTETGRVDILKRRFDGLAHWEPVISVETVDVPQAICLASLKLRGVEI